MIYHKCSDSSSGGGFVNNAFEDDDEVSENRVTYARWINRTEYKDDSEIELGVKKNSHAEDLDDVLRNRSKESDDKTDQGAEDGELNIYMTPSPGVSRRLMLRRLSTMKSDDQVCTDQLCPYNRWLYHGEEFPEYKLLKKWEVELRRKYPEQDQAGDLQLDVLDPRQLARLLHRRSERHKSASERSPSFSFTSFQFPSIRSQRHKEPPHPESESTPIPSQPPPYTFTTFTSPSTISANYPIVTLPRSQRKERSSLFNSLFKPSSELNISMNDSLPWKTPYRPPSTASSSCSCSSSSCSSCSSCYDMERVNHVRLAQYPFIRDSIKKNTGRSLRLSAPRCDLTCYFITSFILLCLAGVAAVFVYFYIFAPIS